MGKFLTSLDVELIVDSDPAQWRVLKPLAYQSDKHGLIVVPSDFVTDFASVPRLPLVYALSGDTAHLAAVVHDWLYTPPMKVPRKDADDILLEASAASGVPAWRRWMMWAGVRVGGGSKFQVPDPTTPS